MKKAAFFASIIALCCICAPSYGQNGGRDWTVYGNLNWMPYAVDGKLDTRAETGTDNYAGRWIEVDLGAIYDINTVVQDHYNDMYDYPGSYVVEVSVDGLNYRPIFRGRGTVRATTANFPTVQARWVRLTAEMPAMQGKWWSIHELKILCSQPQGDAIPKAQAVTQ